jgi:ParB family chromosome partitioning protein
MKVRIDDIIVGRRIRGDAGDLTDLVESIRRHGLMNPITVTDRLRLVAGYRRMQACRMLGIEEIECRIIVPDSKVDMLLMEAEENRARKNLTASDMERFEEAHRYLKARGLEKLKLWFVRVVRRFMEWARKLLGSEAR